MKVNYNVYEYNKEYLLDIFIAYNSDKDSQALTNKVEKLDHYLRNKIIGIYQRNIRDDLPLEGDERNNNVFILKYVIKIKSLAIFLSKTKNKQEKRLMAAPYAFWNIVALKDECKRRDFDVKEYKNVTDKDVIIKLLKFDDKNKKDGFKKKSKKKKSVSGKSLSLKELREKARELGYKKSTGYPLMKMDKEQIEELIQKGELVKDEKKKGKSGKNKVKENKKDGKSAKAKKKKAKEKSGVDTKVVAKIAKKANKLNKEEMKNDDKLKAAAAKWRSSKNKKSPGKLLKELAESDHWIDGAQYLRPYDRHLLLTKPDKYKKKMAAKIKKFLSSN